MIGAPLLLYLVFAPQTLPRRLLRAEQYTTLHNAEPLKIASWRVAGWHGSAMARRRVVEVELLSVDEIAGVMRYF